MLSELDAQVARSLGLAEKAYAQSIGAAWEIVLEMERRGYFWIVRDTGAVFWKWDGRKPVQVIEPGAANTAATICRAAVAALGNDPKHIDRRGTDLRSRKTDTRP